VGVARQQKYIDDKKILYLVFERIIRTPFRRITNRMHASVMYETSEENRDRNWKLKNDIEIAE